MHKRPIQAMCTVCVCVLSHVQLFVIPWTAASQAPLPMGLSRQEYWSGLSFPSPGDLPDPDRICVYCIAGRFFNTSATLEASQPMGRLSEWMCSQSCEINQSETF